MANLTSLELLKLETIFDMSGGYVLDFSTRSFTEFMKATAKIDIYNERYSYNSGSKANRLRAFFSKESDELVGYVIKNLLERWKFLKRRNNEVITLPLNSLYEECLQIAERLTSEDPLYNASSEATRNKDNKNRNLMELELKKLFEMYDELTRSNEPQRRGYLLQEILRRLFALNRFDVKKSFQRNDGGEQIDGGFMFDGWYYLVECKWTKTQSQTRDLDSLLGKVNRGGKQLMGLFLSIEGWSVHVVPLLKQNPEKCIILMDGSDLYNVLSGKISLGTLIKEKLSWLNQKSEPFLSAISLINR